LRYSYICSECDRSFDISSDLMVCPHCSEEQKPNQPLRGVLEVHIEGKVERDFDIFDLLPVEREYFPPIPVGGTPLWTPLNLRRITGFSELYIKDDSLNPTGSLKDRASYLVAAFARREGLTKVVVASTGNAASSMAGVGAAADLKIRIFIPASAPQAKRVQALQYGAEVVLVDGNYDRAYELSMEYTREHGGLNSLNLGLIEKIPIMYAVQAEGSCAICRALETKVFSESYQSKTVADSIAVDVPRNGFYALTYLEAYNGRGVTVEDGEIIAAQKMLASTTGLFAEPAASAALAGFLKEKGNIPTSAKVVLLVTGNGLKDIDAAMQGVLYRDEISNV